MDACPGHILESTKGIEMKLGLYIDDNQRKGIVHVPYPDILESIIYIEIKLGTNIDVNERKCSRKEP